MLLRFGIWVAVMSGFALFAAAAWVMFGPDPQGAADARLLVASETEARWAILGVLGALLGNVLLFLNLRIAADATRAASVAADAARDAVEHQRQTSQMELRPYMVMEDPEWTPLHDDEPDVITAWRLKVTWRNAGRTPARNVCLRLMTADRELPPGDPGVWTEFAFPDPMDAKPSVGSVAAGNVIANTHDVDLDKMLNVHEGVRTLIFYGWIEYDGFPDAPRHRSECAMRVRVVTSPDTVDALIDHDFVEAHNGDDESCLYRPRTMKGVSAPQRMAPRSADGARFNIRGTA